MICEKIGFPPYPTSHSAGLYPVVISLHVVRAASAYLCRRNVLIGLSLGLLFATDLCIPGGSRRAVTTPAWERSLLVVPLSIWVICPRVRGPHSGKVVGVAYAGPPRLAFHGLRVFRPSYRQCGLLLCRHDRFRADHLKRPLQPVLQAWLLRPVLVLQGDRAVRAAPLSLIPLCDVCFGQNPPR